MGAIVRRVRALQRRMQAIPTLCAWFYAALVRRGLARSERRIADDVAPGLGSGTVLDLGSGPGQLAIDIAERAPAASIVGVDLSPEMVRLARMYARGIPNVSFVLADAAALPLEDESVDSIISTGALHHFADPAMVFAECRRVLKPGGEGHVYDGCPGALDARADELRAQVGRVRYWLYHKVAEIHGAPVQEYETRVAAALDAAGFAGHYEMSLGDIWMQIVFRKPALSSERG